MEFVSFDIESNDFRRAGAASRAIKEHLKRIGADAEAIRRTMIAAYEAEMNVVIHSVGGQAGGLALRFAHRRQRRRRGPGHTGYRPRHERGLLHCQRRGPGAGLRGRDGPAEHQAQQRPPAGHLAGRRRHPGELHRLPQPGGHGCGPEHLPLRFRGPLPRLPGLPHGLSDSGAPGTGWQTERARASLHRLQPVHRGLQHGRVDRTGRPSVGRRRGRPGGCGVGGAAGAAGRMWSGLPARPRARRSWPAGLRRSEHGDPVRGSPAGGRARDRRGRGAPDR